MMHQEDRALIACALRAFGDEHTQMHSLAHQRHFVRRDILEDQLVVIALLVLLDDRVVAIAACVDIGVVALHTAQDVAALRRADHIRRTEAYDLGLAVLAILLDQHFAKIGLRPGDAVGEVQRLDAVLPAGFELVLEQNRALIACKRLCFRDTNAQVHALALERDFIRVDPDEDQLVVATLLILLHNCVVTITARVNIGVVAAPAGQRGVGVVAEDQVAATITRRGETLTRYGMNTRASIDGIKQALPIDAVARSIEQTGCGHFEQGIVGYLLA